MPKRLKRSEDQFETVCAPVRRRIHGPDHRSPVPSTYRSGGVSLPGGSWCGREALC
ncbi:hypothetical protein SGL43_00798 [Streptomyces globisporus]|uniref:Uncharacterized protein n=1 Tax=Streptomyces globisporus TaxID=1908 RepID=A0ABN8UU86_STRGL|nr:hypothetical protein SGL43_00798 [Streptomyces globisporus]